MKRNRLMKVVGLLLGIGLFFGTTATSEAKKANRGNPANDNFVTILGSGAEDDFNSANISITDAKLVGKDLNVAVSAWHCPYCNPDNRGVYVEVHKHPAGGLIAKQVWPTGELAPLGSTGTRTFTFSNILATPSLTPEVKVLAVIWCTWCWGDSDERIVPIPVEPDYIKVTPTPVEVIIGQTQQFTAKGYSNGPDGIEGTADDKEVPISPTWSTAGGIGEVNQTGSFTAVEELPEKKDKLVGHVVASVTTTEGEKIQGKAKVTVIAYAKLSYLEAVDAKDSTRKSRETLQMASVKLLEKRTATITAYKDKPEMDWVEDEPVWWGLVDNKGVDSVTYTGTKDGKEHARAGNVPKLVAIEVVNGVEHEFSISTGTFKVFQDILVKVATALKGDKDKIKVSPISGSLKWYKVDQIRSPLCQTTYEFSVSPGGFEYDVDKFYIPSLSINFRWVKIGIFVKPDLSLKITAIEIIRDGTMNPVKFTKLSGGAGLEGSISGGGGAEFKVKKVFTVEVDLKGTASASGDFKASLPGPKLSGTYIIGKITVSGEVVIEYRERPVVTKKVTKPVWAGITGTGEVDLASFFKK